jgi:hypothetical protein
VRSEERFSPSLSRRDLSIGGGFRLIYEIGLGPRLGLWAWPYVGYAWQHSQFPRQQSSCASLPAELRSFCLTSSPRQQSDHVFRFGLLLPLMFHLTQSWAIGAGPRFEVDVAVSSTETLSYGLASQLIGSF